MFVAACSSDSDVRREEYLDADYYTRLELPPDLTEPDSSRKLRLPQPSQRAQQQFSEDTKDLGEKPVAQQREQAKASNVAINVTGATLRSDQSGYWLELDKSVDDVWPLLRSFWEEEGIPVKRSQSAIGMMETDWIKKLQIAEDAGFFEKIFSNFEPDRVDRFNVRLEQGAKPSQSKLYVTHAGMEMVVEGDDSNWRSREREPALEAEILKRFALYIGAEDPGNQSLLQGHIPFASRSKVSSFDGNSLEVIGDRQKVWNRTIAALQDMNIDISRQDATTGILHVQFEQLAPELRGEERDEIAESSWLMQMFSGAPEGGAKFVLQLTELENYTRIDIKKDLEELDHSVLAEQFSASLMTALQ